MAPQPLWNWQRKNWPSFMCDLSKTEGFEKAYRDSFLIRQGSERHLSNDALQDLKIHLITDEAYRTSEIEGELLNPESLKASLQRQFGLKAPKHSHAAENGLAEMMADVHTSYNAPLTKERLYQWHAMLLNGRRDIKDIGAYRTHEDPMQIVSGPTYAPKVHYEAPPSSRVPREMESFIKWFNDATVLPDFPLTKAAIAHLYFESIHPFEDGNGRIGRALVDKSLSMHARSPMLLSLSTVIQEHKKGYYEALHQASQTLEITPWCLYFCDVILKAQRRTDQEIDFLIQKGKFLTTHADHMNERQRKAVLRLFEEGVTGFKGGLSAHNYQRITGALSATTTRDLTDLVSKKILTKTGERKHTRYWLNIPTD